MKIRFITDCVIGQTEFAEGQVYDQDDAAAHVALAQGRAVPVEDPAAAVTLMPAAEVDDEVERE